MIAVLVVLIGTFLWLLEDVDYGNYEDHVEHYNSNRLTGFVSLAVGALVFLSAGTSSGVGGSFGLS